MNWISFVVIIVVLVCLYYVVRKGYTNSLYMLHRKAYFKYRSEVITGQKSYERYVKDFCNSNRIISGENVEQLQQQNKNYGIIEELLCQRYDIVSKYFSSTQFSIEDFKEMNREFNTTYTTDLTIKEEPKNESKEIITEKKKIVGKENPFNCRLKKNQFDLLTECINELSIFKTVITSDDLEEFFFCRLNGSLKSNNTRLFAYLMDMLYANNFIKKNWQSVIEREKLMLRPLKDDYLTANDLSSANNNYPKGAEIIDDYIKQLKKH